MTHHEATRDDHAGFASACPGELARLGEYPDYVLTAKGREPRTVTVYRCGGCGDDLSLARREGEAPEVLNVYRRPDPARIAADLAARLATMPGPGRGS